MPESNGSFTIDCIKWLLLFFAVSVPIQARPNNAPRVVDLKISQDVTVGRPFVAKLGSALSNFFLRSGYKLVLSYRDRTELLNESAKEIDRGSTDSSTAINPNFISPSHLLRVDFLPAGSMSDGRDVEISLIDRTAGVVIRAHAIHFSKDDMSMDIEKLSLLLSEKLAQPSETDNDTAAVQSEQWRLDDDIVRNNDSSIHHMNWDEAFEYCLNQNPDYERQSIRVALDNDLIPTRGVYLPVIRQLAKYAQSLGARGIYEAFDPNNPLGSIYVVNAHTSYNVFDTFNFDHHGYHPPTEISENYFLWSASLFKHKRKGREIEAYGLDVKNGHINPYSEEAWILYRNLSTVRCARSL